MKTKKCYETHLNCNGDTCDHERVIAATQGPWKYQDSKDKNEENMWIVLAKGKESSLLGGEQIICSVHPTVSSESEANARLIAAAPLLLHTAKHALDCLLAAGIEPGDGNDIIGKLKSAIAKAEGEIKWNR